jgi:hypothetical protein
MAELVWSVKDRGNVAFINFATRMVICRLALGSHNHNITASYEAPSRGIRLASMSAAGMAPIDKLRDGCQPFARRAVSQLSLVGKRLACVLVLRDALDITFHK